MDSNKPSTILKSGKTFVDAVAAEPPTPEQASSQGDEKDTDRGTRRGMERRTQSIREEEERLRAERKERPDKRQKRWPKADSGGSGRIRADKGRPTARRQRRESEDKVEESELKRQKLENVVETTADVELEKTAGDVNSSDAEKEDRPSLVSAVQRIHWAPINIPLPRRLQMAAVLWHTLSMSIFFAIFWFVLAIPLFWPLLLPYLIYVFIFARNHVDGSAPYRRSELLRNLPIWRLYADYFPMRLHRTVELDSEKNYIFACHPHGIISHGVFGNLVTEATGFSQLFPGIKNTVLTLDTNFSIPFNREYLLALGLASVSKRSCEALLRGEGVPKSYFTSWFNWFNSAKKDRKASGGGRAISIVVGGARESLEAQPGTMKLVCKKRRGFLKLAIREGAGVVPVLSFGENDLYEQLVPGEGTWLRTMQMTIKKSLGFTVPLMHARGVFNYDVGLLPYRREINTVVGKPIFPMQNTDPSEKDIADFQELYIEELRRMWDEWKDVFAKNRLPEPDGELQIVE